MAYDGYTRICTDCRGPVYWVQAEGAWYHQNSMDMLTCPGPYPITPTIPDLAPAGQDDTLHQKSHTSPGLPGATALRGAQPPARQDPLHVGRHIATEELERRIKANYEERTATHRAMLTPEGDPLVSVFGAEWAELSSRYELLAAQSGDLWAELCRREATHA